MLQRLEYFSLLLFLTASLVVETLKRVESGNNSKRANFGTIRKQIKQLTYPKSSNFFISIQIYESQKWGWHLVLCLPIITKATIVTVKQNQRLSSSICENADNIKVSIIISSLQHFYNSPTCICIHFNPCLPSQELQHNIMDFQNFLLESCNKHYCA